MFNILLIESHSEINDTYNKIIINTGHDYKSINQCLLNNKIVFTRKPIYNIIVYCTRFIVKFKKKYCIF